MSTATLEATIDPLTGDEYYVRVPDSDYECGWRELPYSDVIEHAFECEGCEGIGDVSCPWCEGVGIVADPDFKWEGFYA